MKVSQPHGGQATASQKMATLVGIGAEGHGVSAIDLLGRLRFPGNELTLVHVAPKIGADGLEPTLLGEQNANDLEKDIGSAATALLLKSAAAAAHSGMGRARQIHAAPSSSEAFLGLANHAKADLVAIAAQERGSAANHFLTEVGHDLAIEGRRSFMIGRGERQGASSIMAVFATDHSEYAKRGFERFLDMNPQGLAYVWIVTAREPGSHPERRMTKGPPDPAIGLSVERENRKRRNGREMVARLDSKGIGGQFCLVDGYPGNVLRGFMDKTHADLMILCAQGESPKERSVVGSVALHAVVAEPYPVLVLRKDEQT